MRVISYPRIHIALADLAGVTHRRFGGSGFAVDGLPTVVRVWRSRESRVQLQAAVDQATLQQVEDLLFRARSIIRRVSVVLESAPPQHVGLGSKTAIIAAVSLALYRLAGRNATRTEIQRLSGRGGASGVGINTFFDGGFVADAGHANDFGASFRPSSAMKGHRPPPVIARHSVPAAWRVTLLLPSGNKYTGASERRFFEQNTPITPSAALRTIALLYHGVATAIVTADLQLLADSLKQIHRTGFKHRELLGQSDGVRRILLSLQRMSIAAGMSSMGPLIYALTDTDRDCEAVLAVARTQRVSILGSFQARNAGYEASDA